VTTYGHENCINRDMNCSLNSTAVRDTARDHSAARPASVLCSSTTTIHPGRHSMTPPCLGK
jgi:hypothetical protein